MLYIFLIAITCIENYMYSAYIPNMGIISVDHDILPGYADHTSYQYVNNDHTRCLYDNVGNTTGNLPFYHRKVQNTFQNKNPNSYNIRLYNLFGGIYKEKSKPVNLIPTYEALALEAQEYLGLRYVNNIFENCKENEETSTDKFLSPEADILRIKTLENRVNSGNPIDEKVRGNFLKRTKRINDDIRYAEEMVQLEIEEINRKKRVKIDVLCMIFLYWEYATQ